MHAGNANEKSQQKEDSRKRKGAESKREREMQKKERCAGVKFNISVAFL